MRISHGLVAGALLTLGAMSANAALIGSVPGCIDTGGPTPETFCNSAFNAQLNTANGFSFSVLFDNQSYVETLLSNPIEVDLFYAPSDFPFPQTITFGSFALLDSVGNSLGFAFNSFDIISPGILRVKSAGAVPANTRIFGYSLALTCDNAVSPYEGACDTGLGISNSAITMNTIENESSLRVGRETAPVPVPATLVLLGIGLAGLGWSSRRS